MPGFDPSAIRRVDEMDILVDYVTHKIGMSRILAYGANGHAMGTIAGDVLRYDVGAVSFNCNTVVACARVKVSKMSEKPATLGNPGTRGTVGLSALTSLYSPVVEENVSGIPGIGAVGVDSEPFVVARGVHVNV